MNVLEQLMTYYAQNGSYVMDEFGRHFLMSAYGVLFAAVVGVPAGILIAHFRRLSAWVFAVTNVIQTIPALAMLAVLTENLCKSSVKPLPFYPRNAKTRNVRSIAVQCLGLP